MGEMLAKISRYLAGEVELSLEDYRLMQANRARRRPSARAARTTPDRSHCAPRVTCGARAPQALNLTAADKYSEMAEYSSGLVALAEQLQAVPLPPPRRALSPHARVARQAKAADLQPQLDQLDQLDGQVGELETAVEQLDAYSRRLETKFDALASRKHDES